MSAQAVILAGGLATRLYPRTRTTPKALLEVAGRPFIDWQLEKIRACGFDDVLLCIGYLGEEITRHVGDGSQFGLKVRYSPDGPKLLGTAGALRQAVDLLPDTFLVTYGDSYLPFDYRAPLASLDAHSDCDAVMSVYKNDGKWDTSNTITDGRWVTCYTKNGGESAFDHIDYGAIALRRSVIQELPLGESMGLEVLQSRLAQDHRLRAVVAQLRFFEIGSTEGLATLDHHLRTAAPNTPNVA